MSERHTDDFTGVETTGHEWDGIKELDTPLPRWWLWVFYASFAWSVVYMIFMPAWPALLRPMKVSLGAWPPVPSCLASLYPVLVFCFVPSCASV